MCQLQRHGELKIFLKKSFSSLLYGLDIFVQNNNVEYLDEKTNTWPPQRAKMVLFGTKL